MNFKRYKHPKVCLCQRCKGTGKVATFNAKGEFEKLTQCPSCKGSGRVVVSAVMDITVVPFDPREKIDSWNSKNQNNDIPQTR